jgi:hypothetical protein
VQRKCPQLVTGDEDNVPKFALPVETVHTILQCLQAFAS